MCGSYRGADDYYARMAREYEAEQAREAARAKAARLEKKIMSGKAGMKIVASAIDEALATATEPSPAPEPEKAPEPAPAPEEPAKESEKVAA